MVWHQQMAGQEMRVMRALGGLHASADRSLKAGDEHGYRSALATAANYERLMLALNERRGYTAQSVDITETSAIGMDAAKRYEIGLNGASKDD
jgi:hypothetical protein